MRQLTMADLQAIIANREGPCISIYQPTHRHHPDNQQDPIRFKNLLKQVESSLSRKYPTREVRPWLSAFHDLAHDSSFWNHTLDGLAVLATPEVFRVFELQRTVPELAVVASSFHAKPLVRYLQSADRYQVLCLNRQDFKLHEGDRDALDEVDLAAGIPRTITEALGDELTEPHRAVTPAGSAGAVHHGHGTKSDVVDIDTERFFRVVDRAVLEHHSRPSGLPLVLVALAEYVSLFRKISHNPFLVANSVELGTNGLTSERLRKETWERLLPQYLRRLAQLSDAFQEARSKQQGSDDLSEIGRAAAAGRVATLLVEADRQVGGRIDPQSGAIEFREIADPETDDLLDDLAEMVLTKAGDVVVVPSERMPARTGAAATYRF